MSEELEKIRSTEVTLRVNGEERRLKFGFSAWAKLEDMYGSLKNFSQIEKDIQEKPFHIIPKLVYIGLVDKSDVTEETVLDDYGMNDIEEISEKLFTALYGSLPVEKKSTVTKKTTQKK